jgi:hypothetical protein
LKKLLLLFGLVAGLGCGPVDDGLPRTVKATGVVLCDGKPLEGAAIVLMQDSGSNFARGISDASGNFSLNTFETKSGAVPGAYKVTVSKTVTVDKATPASVPKTLAEDSQHAAEGDEGRGSASWVNDLPDKYNSPATSGLSVTIPEEGTSDIRLELTRK